MEMFLSGYFHRKENQPKIIIRKRQITIKAKTAEIYKGDSIKSNIHRQPLGLLLVGIEYRKINHQTRKGVRKAPLPGLSAYRDCRMGNSAMLYFAAYYK